MKNKYNVAYLMHGARNIGGGEHSLFLLIKNLNKDIFKPIVFYAQDNEIVRKIQREGIETIKIPLHKKIISVYRDKIKYNLFTIFSYCWHLANGILMVRRILKDEKIILLYPHDNLSKIIGSIAARISGVKVVTCCHDCLQNKLIDNILRFVYLYLTDRTIVVSEKVLECLKMNDGLLGRKLKLIHNGVDLDTFDPVRITENARVNMKISCDWIVLGIIAVLQENKGHTYLFQAIQRLKKDGISNMRCLVIGDGGNRDVLFEFVRDNNLREDISLLGYREDIPKILKAIDILVIPSVEESFSRVAIEGMAMKVPIVCTDAGGLPEVIVDGQTGTVVPAKNVDALYRGIKYLIENPDIRKQMGEAGRKRVEERFTIETNVRKIEELYLDVLKVY